MDTITGSYKPTKMESCRVQCKYYICRTTPVPKARGTDQKRGQEIIVRARHQGVCSETVSPGNVRRYSHEVSPIWQPKHGLDRDNGNRRVKADRGKATRPQTHTKNSRNLRNARSRGNSMVVKSGRSLSCVEHTDWIPNAKRPTLKTYIWVTWCRPSRLYLGMYMCTYMYLCPCR